MHFYKTSYNSPLGKLHISCTATHVTDISFTKESDDGFEKDDNDVTALVVQQLDGYFKGTRQLFEIPMLQSGTPFQAKVWDLLCAIPYGKTVSYRDLSKKYGDVKAIRAVASANGKNNLAIVVPCHRVIGANAGLTGYMGGLWRKQWLLQHEAKYYAGVQQLF